VLVFGLVQVTEKSGIDYLTKTTFPEATCSPASSLK